MEISNSSTSSTAQNSLQMTFSWLDYIFFAATLISSTLIGIYFGCFGSKQKTIFEYLMGNKAMKPVPIAISLVASHVAVLTIVIMPVETYRFGAYFLLTGIALVITCIINVYIYLPVFFNLEITSVHEYLGKRFDKKSRLFTSFLFALATMFHLSINMYVGALSCSAATGINVHFFIPFLFFICIFYTSLGGMKSVVWSDTLQYIIMIGSVLLISIFGINSEGFPQIWKKAFDGDRLDIFDFDLDPTKRISFWSVVVGLSSMYLQAFCVHQTSIQKYLSLPKFRDAVQAVIYSIIFTCVIQVIITLIGLTIYARYSDCDPFTSKAIEKVDQLIPYFIMDVAGNVPGLSGLFIAGVVSAALSTISACLNCMAGTIYEDFLKPFFRNDTPEPKINRILRLLVVVEGIICLSLVYLIEHLGELLALTVSFQAVTNGPTFGVFTLGILFPRVNSKGAFYGAVCGFVTAASVVLPSKYYHYKGFLKDIPLKTSTNGCQFSNNHTASVNKMAVSNVPYLFRISFFYHTLIGTLATVVMGLVISYMTKKSRKPVDKNLISPISRFLLFDKEKNYDSNGYGTVEEALNAVTTDQEYK